MKNNYPFILAHGIARFDLIQHALAERLAQLGASLSDEFHYFKGIRSFLSGKGFQVFHANVGFAGSVETRATQLADQIRQIIASSGKAKVHIIAHSMGGLDARRMIANIADMEVKVASLTTIGTPHHGTSFANWGLERGGQLWIELLRPVLHLDGFSDLTPEACEAFNDSARAKEASNTVFYQTYSSAEQLESVFFPLQFSWKMIQRAEGANDGLVSVTSQAWESRLEAGGVEKEVPHKTFPFPADHLNEVGWWDPNEFSGKAAALSTRASIETFEAQVKGVYLKIAHEVSALPA